MSRAQRDALYALFRLRRGNFQLDIDLTLPGKGVTVLFGHSGSGKTSLIRSIAGLDKPDYGFLRVQGEVWQDTENQQFVPTHRRAIGYVFQEASLFPHLDVRRNLEFGLKRRGEKHNADTLDRAVALLGIEGLLKRMPEGLSGGERQRVAIARALAVNPKLLLMDEPLASLDPARKREVLPFLQSLQKEAEMPIVYVTHSPDEVTWLADHLVVLEQGRVKVSGPLEQALAHLDSPLARDADASAVVSARVLQHELEFGTTLVEFAGHTLTLSHQSLEAGANVRLRIHARDVMLHRQLPADASMFNFVPATITNLVATEEGYCFVQLDVSGSPLLAQVLRKSAQMQQLQVGMTLFAQIKGVAILS